MRRIIPVSLFLLLAACSSGGPGTVSTSPGPGGGSCQSVTAALCDKACSCGGGGKCRIASVTDSGSASISFNDASGCRALYASACNDDDGSIDWGACGSAVSSASCTQTSSGGAVAVPAACSR